MQEAKDLIQIKDLHKVFKIKGRDVVALEGDRVLRLTYNGALDLSDWYGEIAAMLTPNS